MIKKFIPIIILMLALNVNALTTLPNANTTDLFTYDSQSLDTQYNLSINDTLYLFRINFDIYNYPITNIYTFKDTQNRSIVVKTTYSKVSGLVYDTINRQTSFYYNNQILTIQKSNFGNDTQFFANNSYLDFKLFNFFKLYDSMYDTIDFSSSLLTMREAFSLKFVDAAANGNVKLSFPFFANTIILPSNSTNVKYTEIYFEYKDNGVAKIENEINSQYNSMNPIFKIVFSFFKLIIKFLNAVSFGTIISDNDVYAYQLYLITPLYYLDFILGTFFSILKFITTMGLLWFITVSEMIIFLYSYSQSNDLLKVLFEIFPHYSLIYWQKILINPLKWIFEKLVKIWS